MPWFLGIFAGCWSPPWSLGLFNGKKVNAYRQVFIQTYGWEPENVHHLCGQGTSVVGNREACCNPFHLQGLTRSQHIRRTYQEKRERLLVGGKP